MYVVELSKENLTLSVAEAISLFGNGNLIDNYFFIKDIKNIQRISYAKRAFIVLLSFNIVDMDKVLSKINWNSIIKKEYKMFYINIDDDGISDRIWKMLEEPKVNIKEPKQQVYFIRLGSSVFCCEKAWENDDGFSDRLPHKRKGLKPISLKPKLARSLVNLSGVKDKRKFIIDPFCGTGGILIEAKLCGLKCKGYDLSSEMVAITKDQGIDASVKDFFDLKEANYIVTELPFGKNTKNLPDNFYKNVIIHLGRILRRKAIVVFPGNINVKSLLNNYGGSLVLSDLHKYYVHKSMTRQICVIQRINAHF
ncbi:hypothetical protein H6503_03200 [Candidatus Woesearchaeota archaeon]|nr:hypothetical protein [Candidatus Woesearchaeota archaeon]